MRRLGLLTRSTVGCSLSASARPGPATSPPPTGRRGPAPYFYDAPDARTDVFRELISATQNTALCDKRGMSIPRAFPGRPIRMTKRLLPCTKTRTSEQGGHAEGYLNARSRIADRAPSQKPRRSSRPHASMAQTQSLQRVRERPSPCHAMASWTAISAPTGFISSALSK